MKINNISVLVTLDKEKNPREVLLDKTQREDLKTFIYYLVNGTLPVSEKQLYGIELNYNEKNNADNT